MPTCNICKYAGRPIYKSPCSECKGFSKYEYEKLQTNADRIRSMTDEELAELLSEPCECYVDLEEDGYRECGNKFCIEHLLNWLQQPAENPTEV